MKYSAAPVIVLLGGFAISAVNLPGKPRVSMPLIPAKRTVSEAKNTNEAKIKCRRVGMMLCATCCEKYSPELKGDGECPAHGPFSFAMDGLAVPCPRCAREKGVCQMCGKPLKEK